MEKIKHFAVNSILGLMKLFPLRKVIVFESSPDFACNSFPVYEKLKKDPEISSKYKLMWLVDDGCDVYCDIDKRDIIYDNPKKLGRIVKNLYYRACSECFVMSNRVKNKVRKKQFFIFLCHGSKTKKTKMMYEIGEGVDCVLCQSHFFDKVICDEYNIKTEQLVYLGYPRCDALFENHRDIKNKFGVKDDEKLIVWLPTYRKHKNSQINGTGNIGIPFIKSAEDKENVKKTLCDFNVKILMKPHPAEDLSKFEKADIPNFEIITDKLLSEQRIKLYELLSASDALISDYSSVFYDWLLCDRPTGLTTEDEEEYKKNRGFALDLDTLYDKAATRLNSLTELCSFIADVSAGLDDKHDGRQEVRELTNIYKDGNSASRVAEFIKNKLNV